MIPHSKPWITNEDRASVDKVLTSGMIARGRVVQEFERAITDYVGGIDTVTCGSGTAALMFALLALDIGRGDEVILPTYVCRSVVDAVQTVGAIPVLCDVGENWNMTEETINKHISTRTKAIIVVHIFGIAADVISFLNFGLPIIEDCCQAFGTKSNGKIVGTIGTLGVYSFHATKCLTTGEGGAVIANNIELITKIRRLQALKRIPSTMNDIQAALGLSQIKRYDEFLSLRLSIATKYLNYLPIDLTTNISSMKNQTIFYRFPLRIAGGMKFEEIKSHFAIQGVAVRRGVDELLHCSMGLPNRDFPNAVKCFEETLSIPILPTLSEEEVNKIIGVINNWIL